jgi:hypothetical protein
MYPVMISTKTGSYTCAVRVELVRRITRCSACFKNADVIRVNISKSPPRTCLLRLSHIRTSFSFSSHVVLAVSLHPIESPYLILNYTGHHPHLFLASVALPTSSCPSLLPQFLPSRHFHVGQWLPSSTTAQSARIQPRDCLVTSPAPEKHLQQQWIRF